MVYIGKARRGQGRPMKMYPAVTRDLRLNRGHSTVSDTPRKAYFRRRPWDYRWVHHQLEDAAHRITVLRQPNVEIILDFLHVDVPFAVLHRLERHEIGKAKCAYPGVVANDQPCMSKQPVLRLGAVWR